MSEHPNFSDFHRTGERNVKSAIRNRSDEYEISGRESDPRVAEAMAHAAKPLIDEALSKMETGEPNGLALLKSPDGKKALSAVPGVMYEDYTGQKHTTTYGQLANKVDQGHAAANKVQVDYYDKLAEAKRISDEAKSDL